MATSSPVRVTAFTCFDAGCERNGEAGKLRPLRTCAAVSHPRTRWEAGQHFARRHQGIHQSLLRRQGFELFDRARLMRSRTRRSPVRRNSCKMRAAPHRQAQIVRDRPHVGPGRTVRAQRHHRAPSIDSSVSS